MTSPPVVPGKRYKGLQSLRFIAATSVVLHHSLMYTHERLNSSVHVWGIGAVELFFAISGLVAVTATRRFQETPGGWRYFLVRRATRIMPMYWVATTIKLATLILAPAAVLHAKLDWGMVARSYVLLPSRNIDGQIAPLLGVAWTLLYESFFIVVFAIALAISRRPILTTGAILSACTIASLWRGTDYPPALVYFSPVLIWYILGLTVGIYTKTRKVSHLFAGLGWVLALHFVTQADRIDVLIRIVVITAMLLAVVFGEEWLERRAPHILSNLGNASYSQYLFHPLIAPTVPATFALLGWTELPLVAVAGSVVLAILAAATLYRWLERPVTAFLQDRLPLASLPRPLPKPVPTSQNGHSTAAKGRRVRK